MKLVEKGIIDLDKPVSMYIKRWHFPPSPIDAKNATIRQLLSHTAGMPLGNFKDRYLPHETMPSLQESLYKEAIPFNNPGMSFSYSNTGYNLLELMIEEVTGRKFDEYMKTEVLIPLGMKQSSFTYNKNFNPPISLWL